VSRHGSVVVALRFASASQLMRVAAAVAHPLASLKRAHNHLALGTPLTHRYSFQRSVVFAVVVLVSLLFLPDEYASTRVMRCPLLSTI